MKMHKGWKLSNGTEDVLYLTVSEYETLKRTPWGRAGFSNWKRERVFILR